MQQSPEGASDLQGGLIAEHMDLVPVSLDLERIRRSLIVPVGMMLTRVIAV